MAPTIYWLCFSLCLSHPLFAQTTCGQARAFSGWLRQTSLALQLLSWDVIAFVNVYHSGFCILFSPFRAGLGQTFLRDTLQTCPLTTDPPQQRPIPREERRQCHYFDNLEKHTTFGDSGLKNNTRVWDFPPCSTGSRALIHHLCISRSKLYEEEWFATGAGQSP